MRVERKTSRTQVVLNKGQKASASQRKPRELKVAPIDPGRHQPLASALRAVFAPIALAAIQKIEPSALKIPALPLGGDILGELVEKSKKEHVNFAEIKNCAQRLDDLYNSSSLDIKDELEKVFKNAKDRDLKIILARLLLALDHNIFSRSFLAVGLDRKTDSKSPVYSFWIDFIKFLDNEELEKIFSQIGEGYFFHRDSVAEAFSQRKDHENIFRLFFDACKLDFDACLPDNKKARAQTILIEYIKKIPKSIVKFEDLKELYLNAGAEFVVKDMSTLLEERFPKRQAADVYLLVAMNDKGIDLRTILETQDDDDDEEFEHSQCDQLKHHRQIRVLAIGSYAEIMKTKAVDQLIEILDSTDDPYIIDEICCLLASKLSCGIKGQTKLVNYVKNQIDKEEESVPFACIVRRAKHNVWYEMVLRELFSRELEKSKLEKAVLNIGKIRLFEFHHLDKDLDIEDEPPSLGFMFFEMCTTKFARWMTVGEDIPKTARDNLINNSRNFVQCILLQAPDDRKGILKVFEKLKRQKDLYKLIREMIGLSNTGQTIHLDKPFKDTRYLRKAGVEYNPELN